MGIILISKFYFFSLLTQDNAMMQRLLARTAFDPEEASKLMHQHHHAVARTKQFPLGYPGEGLACK